MRKCLSVAVFLALAFAVSAQGVGKEELSYEARSLLPADEVTVVKLTNGTEYEGTLMGDTGDMIMLRVEDGGVSQTKNFQKSEVEYVGSKDVSTAFAVALLDIRLNPDQTLTSRQYDRGINLFTEFLTVAPKHAHAKIIRERMDEFKEEKKMAAAGMLKHDGGFVNEVEAMMRRYQTDVDTMKRLEREHRGVKESSPKVKKEIRETYEKAKERRRDTIRELPRKLKISVEMHIRKKKFSAAINELDQFQKLWLNVAMKEDSKAGKVDLGFITSLQGYIMKAYVAGGGGKGSFPRNRFKPPGMVYIPSGYFIMGTPKTDERSKNLDQGPTHIVYCGKFLIDRYEVSNRQYNKFVAHVKSTGNSSYEHPDAPPLKDHTSMSSQNPALSGDSQPVMGIDWYDAYAYAQYSDKRLPTEAEWEKAARGMKIRKYPWGKAAPGQMPVNCAAGRGYLSAQMDAQNPPPPPKQDLFQRMGCKDPTPPNRTSLPAVSWPVEGLLASEAMAMVEEETFVMSKGQETYSFYNVYHMAGNAAEWVNDWYGEEYYYHSDLRDPKGPENGAYHVYRGGYYMSPDAEFVTSWRGKADDERYREGQDKGRKPMIGFRCVKGMDDDGLRRDR